MSSVMARVGGGIGGGLGLARTRSRPAWARGYGPALVLGPLLAGLAVLGLWRWVTVVIPAGHVGVAWHRFDGGTDTRTVHGEGNRFIAPWDRMVVYDARLQHVARDFDVLTRDGLTMSVSIGARYRLNDRAVGLLHKHVGPDYVETLLAPALGSLARVVFSQNSTDAVYTDRRLAVQDEIRQAVAAELDRTLAAHARGGGAWLTLDDVLIRGMRFPPDIQAAVNRKMAQAQLREEYAYRLQREELESRRKEVEARGIARFQEIVGAGISDTYLRWKGIDATLALAQSPNAKVVLIGTGRDGMPLMLGGLDPVSAPGTPSTGAGPSSNLKLDIRAAQPPLREPATAADAARAQAGTGREDAPETHHHKAVIPPDAPSTAVQN